MNSQELLYLVIISSIFVTLLCDSGRHYREKSATSHSSGIKGLRAILNQQAMHQGPVAQRPISANPGLNFYPGFLISFFQILCEKGG